MSDIMQISWGAPSWLPSATGAVVVGILVVLWSYARSRLPGPARLAAALLKALGIALLAVCLLEPQVTGVRPKPGANWLLILADNSRSLQLRDRAGEPMRGDRLRSLLVADSPWQTRLGQSFEIRRYLFDSRLRPVPDFATLHGDGDATRLVQSLRAARERHRSHPVAGVLVLTDGNSTEQGLETLDTSEWPPIYPVVIGEDLQLRDVSVARVHASQSNFESAPVTIQAEVGVVGYSRQPIVAALHDPEGRLLEARDVVAPSNQQPAIARFQTRPERSGILFYEVRAYPKADGDLLECPDKSTESTLINNRQFVLVERQKGPYRVLYVGGRPNWDFKFLRRALEVDDEVDLVALIRIAKREAKFTFRGHLGERTNPLFRGFGNDKDDTAEQYDEPVFVRLQTRDDRELMAGFPKAADELFAYDGVILDDVEAAFFSRDQMSLLAQFVSQRGGGLMMLGGQESFASGNYDRTPVGDMMPVYLDRERAPDQDPNALTEYRLVLTREGLLQPWVRLRATEDEEQQRIRDMPTFRTLNRQASVKPGAEVLAEVTTPAGDRFPAIVAQRFGKGRTAAFALGDHWRWQLQRKSLTSSDLEIAWRQAVRWLVADVPRRVSVESRIKPDDPNGAREIRVTVLDESYQPLDSAAVIVHVTTPNEQQIELQAEPRDAAAGVYSTTFVPRVGGKYHARIEATSADRARIGECETGWCFSPDADELRALRPNRELLERLARQTGGEVVSAGQLESLVDSLPNRKTRVEETWIHPLWHQWSVLLLAVACLVGEWGLRRWHGLR